MKHSPTMSHSFHRETQMTNHKHIACSKADCPMVQTRGKATNIAREEGGRTRSGKVPQSRIDAQLKTPLKLKDKQLSSVAPDVRKREAARRLKDVEEPAGRPGSNLCPYTGELKAEYQTGKRPWAFTKKKLGTKTAVKICGPVAKEAWSDPKFLAEQRRACGDREYVYPYTRNGKKVKGHCRKLSGPQRQSMERAAQKVNAKKQQRQLDMLIRKRDRTNDMTTYTKLDKEVKALRKQLKPPRVPVTEEPDELVCCRSSSLPRRHHTCCQRLSTHSVSYWTEPPLREAGV
eukprot:COSAG06_NODE_66_length_26393_cov_6.455161_11_plen_289_part_00